MTIEDLQAGPGADLDRASTELSAALAKSGLRVDQSGPLIDGLLKATTASAVVDAGARIFRAIGRVRALQCAGLVRAVVAANRVYRKAERLVYEGGE